MKDLNSDVAVLPTQHAAWLRTAAACLGGRRDETIDGLQDKVSGSGLTVMRVGAGPRRLAPIAAAETGEPSDLPWSDADDLRRRASLLARQGRAIELPRVPAASRSVEALRAAFAGRGVVLVREAPPTPYILLDESWKEPESCFNAGRRSDFRRAQRHAEKLGALSFEMHDAPDAATLDRLLDDAYEVEARSWKGEGGTALAGDPVLGPFFRRYAHAANEAGILRLSFMRIAGQAVGMQLAVEHAGSFWLLKIGYDPAYSKSSPGNLLMLYTLGEAARRGLASYEFLGSTAPWTAAWTSELRSFHHVRLYPRSLGGLLALAQDACTAWRARLREHRQARLAAAQAPASGPALAPASAPLESAATSAPASREPARASRPAAPASVDAKAEPCTPP